MTIMFDPQLPEESEMPMPPDTWADVKVGDTVRGEDARDWLIEDITPGMTVGGRIFTMRCGEKVHVGQPIPTDPVQLTNQKEPKMSDFKKYRLKNIKVAEMTPWTPDFDMTRVSVSEADKEAGSPKEGDMIRHNPDDHSDQWLVAEQYFTDNFEPIA